VRTDKNGRYKINTIKPGSYPGRRDPAHIHAIVRLPGEQPKWIDDFLFEGDPFHSERDIRQFAAKGRFSSIMKITKEPDGLLRYERDIRITSGR
jgi:protocatechuate 3,4-dioxygenase beta subunit